MTTTLITGANKGLGRETARQLIAAGHTVYVGARDEQRGKEAAAQLGARFVLIDVTSDDSVAAAAAQIQAETGGLDVLVNNAGIPGGRTFPGDVTAADVQRVYAVNVYGVVRVTHAFSAAAGGQQRPRSSSTSAAAWARSASPPTRPGWSPSSRPWPTARPRPR